MRKILTQKFWSLGTSLGSMGSLSQKGPPEIFSNVVFLHPWGPNKAPSNAFEPLLVEKLKMFPARCVLQSSFCRTKCVFFAFCGPPQPLKKQVKRLFFPPSKNRH